MNEFEAVEHARKFADFVTRGEHPDVREDCHTYAMVGFMQGWAETQRAVSNKAELLSRVNTELQALRS